MNLVHALRFALLTTTGLSVLACLSEPTDTPSPTPSPTTQPTDTQPADAQPPATQAPVPTGELPKTAGSFETAKKWLYEKVQPGHELTLYCSCTYTPDKKVNLASCDLTALGTSTRANRTEAEHVFPASRIGARLRCWNEPICTRADGESYKGRECCEDIDPWFETAHNDLHNLYPEVGSLNGSRGDYDFGMVDGEAREYGGCDFEINRDTDLVEPTDSVRGEIARAYLYMETTYGLPLTSDERKMLLDWHSKDPPEEWERERNRRITEIQGVGNPYVQ